jgi:hypothetical protein
VGEKKTLTADKQSMFYNTHCRLNMHKISLCTKFPLPSINGSLLLATKLKSKEYFRTSTTFLFKFY